jgi:hypothetical protein
MNIPSEEFFCALLVQQFRRIGLEKTLGSLSIDELDSISEDIVIGLKKYIADDQKDDEPPF